MSKVSKNMTASKLNDAVLGVFSRFNSSETLDHLLRYLSTWSGSDKLFMLIQYTAKLVIPLLHLRARLQQRAGLRKDAVSSSATSLGKLASIIGDARTLWRIWGLLPIVQWLIALEKSPPPTRSLLNIERLQGWSMLLYYPLEHLSYLLSHSVIPTSVPSPSSIISNISFLSSFLSSGPSVKPNEIHLDANFLSIWSTRFWAAYVGLQFLHLREDAKLLGRRERSIAKAKGKAGSGGTAAYEVEKAEVRKRWDALLNELVVNLGYLPLTIHWSLEQGLFKNDVYVSLFGFIAAAASFRSGWNATALPSASAELELAPLTTYEPSPQARTDEKQGTVFKSTGKLGRQGSFSYEDALAMPSLVHGDLTSSNGSVYSV